MASATELEINIDSVPKGKKAEDKVNGTILTGSAYTAVGDISIMVEYKD